MKQTLKKFSAFMMAMAISGAFFAQVPQKFNYQGIARDTKGNPMAQQRMTLKLTVLPTSDATEGEYEEIQSVTTNEFGLYNLQIGNGTPVKGEMKTVKWETGNKYIKVAIDPKGGNDFVDAGTTQLLSVPYAIYADKAGMAKTTASSDRAGTVSTSAAGTGTVNYLTKFTAANTIYNSQMFDNGTNVGIGTTTPSAKFHINQNVVGVQEHMRMQNLSTTGAGRFTLYSDGATNYSTFTKYGSAYAGSYVGLTGLYPLGNLLAFGNNGVAANDGLGRFLISTAGNAGISIFKGGTSKLKFHADFTTENVGIGGNAVPISRVHLNNTDGTTMDLRLTNTTSGHTATDGMTITQSGANTSIINRENGFVTIGTNNIEQMRITSNGNVGIGTILPQAKLHIVTSTDTAGFFTSNSSNYVAEGVLRGEYIGSEIYDHVGVYGKALPDSNNAYGIGVRGDGGYMGGLFLGITKDNAVDVYGAYGSGVGNADVIGLFGAGVAQDTTITVGVKYGVFGAANGGLENRGVLGVGESKLGNEAIGVKASANGAGLNYGIWSFAPTTGGSLAGYFDGNVQVAGNLSKSGGTFKIDHPQDPANKYLIHSFVESPDMKNIYDGNITTDANGIALIMLPSYFEAENKDFRYQLTVLGKDARAYVVEKINNNQFKIKTSEPATEVSWQVTGIRKDAWADANRVIPEVEKTGSEKGKFIHPTLFGQPAQQGIHYSEETKPILDIQTQLNNKNRK